MVLFFSSRGGDATTTLPKNDASKGGFIKSKWYGKQRSTSSPVSPPDQPRSQPSSSSIHHASTSASQSRSPSALKTVKGRNSTSSSRPPPVPPKDNTVTMTLAARLDELEVSNADGLLDDEGYRMLRQNLFASFASSATPLPAEAPPVRLAGPSRSRDSKILAPESNFHLSHENAESIRSNRSRSTVSTVVTNIFKRGGRASTSSQHAGDDDVSVFSGNSRPSLTMKRNPSLSYALHAGSSGSLGSDQNSSQPDLRSVSSRRTGRSGLAGSSLGPGSRAPSRTMRQPPSAYHLRNLGAASSEEDEDHRQSSAELRAEISAVEAEYKRIVSNYTGAEMAALVKRQERVGVDPPGAQKLAEMAESSWTLVTSSGDANSSNAWDRKSSIGSKSQNQNHKPIPLSFGRAAFGSLRRKPSDGSSSRGSVSTSSLRPRSPLPPSPLHLQPTGAKSSLRPSLLQQSRSGSTVSVNTTDTSQSLHGRSSLSVLNGTGGGSMLSDQTLGPGSDSGGAGDDAERDSRKAQRQLDRIRSSKEDATRRYEARLEHLRVKLRSAEIHEKLLKK